MDHIRVSTSQNVEIEYPVASLGDRILAHLLDMALFIVLMICAVASIAMFSLNGADTSLIVLIGIYMALYVFYDLVCEVFFNGQSIGKKVLKIRVISIDGTQPTLGQYVLRWVFRLIDFTLTSNLAALISVAASEKKQRIGDIVAGTTLIKTQPQTTLAALAFRPVADNSNYQVRFPEAAQLQDEDITLIHDVISNYYKSGNTAIVIKMAERVRQQLATPTPENMDSMQYLQTVISDYNHLIKISAQP